MNTTNRSNGNVNENPKPNANTELAPRHYSHTPCPFHVAVPILVERSYKHLWRNPLLFSFRIQMLFSYAILLILYFQPLTHDQYSIQNRIGFLYSCITTVSTAIQAGLWIFMTERNTFYREREDKAYDTISFFISFQITEIPIQFFSVCLFTVMTYFTIGLHPGAIHILAFLAVMVCLVLSGESLAMLLSAISFDGGLVLSIGTCVFCLFIVMSGFFSLTISPILKSLNFVSICKSGAYLLTVNEFSGLVLDCTDEQKLPNGECPITSGDQVLSLYGFEKTLWKDYVCVIVSVVVGYRLLAFLLLRFLKKRFSQ